METYRKKGMEAGLRRGEARLWCRCQDGWVDPMVSFGNRVAFVMVLSWTETASLLDPPGEQSRHAGLTGRHVTLA